MRERKQVVRIGPICVKCKRWDATHIADINAAVTVARQYLCTRCWHRLLIKYPASTAVAITRTD